MKLRRLLLHNFWWKVASLTFATLLWFAIVGEPELVTLKSAEVYYAGLSHNFILLSDPGDVELELRGPSAMLNRESLNRIQILLDLTSVQSPGQQTFAISTESVNLPTGVVLLSAVPSTLVLEFDRRVNKTVPIRPALRGDPAAGHRVSSVIAEPATVNISGPQSRLAAIEHVETTEIDVTGAMQDQQVRVSAFVADPSVQLASAAVSVRLTIEKGLIYPHP